MTELLNPFERVRQSTAQVVAKATQVSWDLDRLQEVVKTYDLNQISEGYTFTNEYHFEGSGELQLNYVFTLDALNFGSGLSPLWKQLEAAQLVQGSLYKTVADTLRREMLQGQTLEPAWAASVTASELAAFFGLPVDFPLVKMFVASLNELGQWVVETHAGQYSALLQTCPTAADLVEALVSHLSHWDDKATYQDQAVYFYKRAQILANDIYLAFKGQAYPFYSGFPDIAQLTMFADNLLPHYFRMVGILHYQPALEAAIEANQPLPAGSEAEVELRAFAVQCVAQACRWLNQSGTHPPVTSAQLDNFLWNFSQSPQIKARPRHRTITYFY